LIIFAGPAVNFLFAIAIFAAFAIVYGERVSPAVVQSVLAGGPAAKAGVVKDDRIVSFDGRSIDRFESLVEEAVMVPNETVEVVIERKGQRITKQVVMGERVEKDRFGNIYRLGQLGVMSRGVEFRKVPWFEAPLVGVRMTYNVLRQQIKGLGQIISGRRPISELGGPLKIAKVSGEALALGVLAFITLAALISINLGFINLLPIPMLDGGHLLLYGVEAVRRRPATLEVQEWAFRAGFVMLVGFMIMVTFNDLASFGLFGR
jgi:regulator of sigma E protease